MKSQASDKPSAHGRFEHIENWIFDLDNTLYPAECNLFAQIDDRMGTFISRYLDIDRVEARRLQKSYFVEYGTTLNGLMTVHDMQPEEFLEFVHDIDHTPVQASPQLDSALQMLPGRKIIFTNGTVKHAERVMDRLNVAHHFTHIYDIVATRYTPKPRAEAYRHLLDHAGIDAASSAFFDDIARNLEIPYSLGMTTIHVHANGAHPDSELGILGTGDEPHIHFVTNDLAGFLAQHCIAGNRR